MKLCAASPAFFDVIQTNKHDVCSHMTYDVCMMKFDSSNECV